MQLSVLIEVPESGHALFLHDKIGTYESGSPTMKKKYEVFLWLLIVSYIAYFGTFSLFRYWHLYAEYFDLGIMHQTVYNTYMALKTFDFSRVLELTTPHGGILQIKRMAIHNDMILALLAPFYFIHKGPETILLIQTVALALGAWAVYKIANLKLKNEALSVIFAFAYLMYSPMQRANVFEFHAVTLATPLILWMFYFWLIGRFRLVFLFLVLALLTKEEVGLSLGIFGLYGGVVEFLKKRGTPFHWTSLLFAVNIMVLSWGWALASVFLIIPFFRGGEHFAAGYYNSLSDTIQNNLLTVDAGYYFYYLLGPLAFLTVFGPEFLIIAAPEFGINLLSSNMQLRSLDFHYTSVIQPWLFIGAIYGASRLLGLKIPRLAWGLSMIIVCLSVWFSYLKGPLPYSQDPKIDALLYDRRGEYEVVHEWADRLASDELKVSTTDQIAPFFTNRRYFYIFAHEYYYADYVIVSPSNIQFTYRKDVAAPAYEELKQDPRFEKIDERNGYEVYRKRK